MKQNLLRNGIWLMLTVTGLVISPVVLAQDEAPAGGQGGAGFRRPELNFLTPAEKQEFLKDREAVMSANPDLKKQAEDLRAEGKALRDNTNATPEDKKAFVEKLRAQNEAVDKAMLQQDPNIQPVLDKIAQHRKDFRENHQGENDAPATS